MTITEYVLPAKLHKHIEILIITGNRQSKPMNYSNSLFPQKLKISLNKGGG